MTSTKRFNPVTAAANLVASQAANREPLSNNREPIIANDYAIVELSDPFGDLLTARRQQRSDTESHAARPVRILPADCPKAIDDAITAIRADVELCRIALGLNQSALLQRWLVLEQLKRETGLQGFTRAELDAALRRFGVSGCDAYNTRLLRRGVGFYWNIDPRTGKIYAAGYLILCKRLLQHADAHGLYDLFTTNHPGTMRPVYINVTGKTADFEASILNAWYTARSNPMISRAVLSALFNRTAFKLRSMEHRAGIHVTPNEAETTEPANVPLNLDGTLRGDVWKSHDADGVIVWHFRLPNQYTATICKQHSRRGQCRKATVLFEQWIATDELPGISAQGVEYPGKLKPSNRFYCQTEDIAKRSRRWGNTNMLYVADRPGEGDSIVWKC